MFKTIEDIVNDNKDIPIPYNDANWVNNENQFEKILSLNPHIIQCFPKAIICGDDFKFEPWASQIKPAVKELAEKYELRFTGDENFWMLHTRPFIYK